MRRRVGFLTTHPIQYQVPIFRLLAASSDVDLVVLYCLLPNEGQQGDGFGVDFQWDVPLLTGYEYVVLNNVSKRPGVTTFRGCDTPEISSQLRHLQLDAMIVNGWVVKSCLQGLWACRRRGIPCLVRGEANNLRPRTWWKRALQRRLVRQYDACLYVGKANREFYQTRGVPDHRLFPAPYCIENDRFAKATGNPGLREQVRRKLGIPSNATCFLFSGKLIPKKHPLELLRAFSEIASRTSNVHLLIVGDGELRQTCETFSRERNLPVSFAGFVNQSQMPGAYAASDCLVLPSDHGETWGLVVNEAMAAGCPAIVSNQVGCAADLIIEGQTGWTFPFDDWSALAGLLQRAAQDQTKLAELGAAARIHIDRYRPEEAANGIVTALQTLGSHSGFRLKGSIQATPSP